MDVMKIGVLILCLVMASSPGGCHAATAAPDQLKANSDGTAIVSGIVLENNYGCARDLLCYLQLRVGTTEVRVVYVGAEGETTPHRRNTDQEGKIKKGDHVEAYGRLQDKNQIEVYSSETFYVHVLNN